jgi:hypothetical protein
MKYATTISPDIMRHRTCEKTDEQQNTAHERDNTREPEQRKRLEFIEHRNVWEMQELGQAVLQEQQRRHDTKHTEHMWRPGRKNRVRDHVKVLGVGPLGVGACAVSRNVGGRVELAARR